MYIKISQLLRVNKRGGVFCTGANPGMFPGVGPFSFYVSNNNPVMLFNILVSEGEGFDYPTPPPPPRPSNKCNYIHAIAQI